MLMFWELKSLANSENKSICWHFCIVSGFIIRVMWITTLILTLILKLLRKKETEQLFRLKDKLIDQLNRNTEQTLIRRQLKHETSYETNPAWHETNARNNHIFSFISISFTNKWYKAKYLNYCMFLFFTLRLQVTWWHKCKTNSGV